MLLTLLLLLFTALYILVKPCDALAIKYELGVVMLSLFPRNVRILKSAREL